MTPKIPRIVVTDHAVVRWLERCMDINVSAIRAKIISDVTPAVALGAATCQIENATFALVRQEGEVRVVTTLSRSAHKGRGVFDKKSNKGIKP